MNQPYSDPDNDGDNDAIPSQDTDQDQGQGQGMGGGSMDMCVPLSSLSEPNEQDQMTTPEVGDIVTMTVEGKINRVNGDDAYITPSAVNGQKIEQPQAPQDEESQLRQMASSMGSTQPSY